MKNILWVMFFAGCFAWAVWIINTPEREPECKPAQLSEILK